MSDFIAVAIIAILFLLVTGLLIPILFFMPLGLFLIAVGSKLD
jgi:hypothetical protein